jgi:hypothetical protein
MESTIDATKIEHGIKIPPKTSGRPKGSGKYVQILKKMKAGNSIVVSNIGARASMFRAAKDLGIDIESRKVEDGYRVWRKK